MSCFTPTIVISAGIEKALTQMANLSLVSLVHALAEQYNFDAEQAIQELGLADVQVTKKRRAAAPKEKKEKKVKEVKPPRDTPKCILPWTGTAVDRDWCKGIKYNFGLYNQCTKERTADGIYCKTCAAQCTKNGTGLPDFGNVEERAKFSLFEYKAGKAQKPCLPLTNVLKKFDNVDRQVVETEAARFGLEIPEEQWEVKIAKRGRPRMQDSEKKAKKPKTGKVGRPPKKAKTQESAAPDDLIASLVADAMKSTESAESSQQSVASAESPKPVKKAKKAKMTEEEKAAKKAAKKAEKLAAKKAAKKAEKEAEKAEKEAEKEAEKAALEKKAAHEQQHQYDDDMDKDFIDWIEQKATLEKKAAEEKAAQEKATLEKKAAEEKAAQEKAVVDELEETDFEDHTDDESDDEEVEKIHCKPLDYNGKKYAHDIKTNIVYDISTMEEVGRYNVETNKIEELDE